MPGSRQVRVYRLVPWRRRGVRLPREEDVQVAAGLTVRVLRLEKAPPIGERAAPRPARGPDQKGVRGVRRDLRLPADPRPAPAVGRALRPRARPGHHAGAGPAAVPAAAVAGETDRGGRPRAPHPGPARAGLQCDPARGEDGRRYYLHSDLARLAVLITYVESDGASDHH